MIWFRMRRLFRRLTFVEIRRPPIIDSLYYIVEAVVKGVDVVVPDPILLQLDISERYKWLGRNGINPVGSSPDIACIALVHRRAHSRPTEYAINYFDFDN